MKLSFRYHGFLLMIGNFLPCTINASTVESLLFPSDDPFYTEPANITWYTPGQVIRSRCVPNGISGLISSSIGLQINTTYQYLYRTTNSDGNAVGAMATLLVPNNPDPKKLLAYQTAYDSANINCSPSYALRAGANTTAVADIILIVAALNQGWYVVTSDFEGLQAQFVNGLMSGYATLDSVHAAFNEAPSSGLSTSARYVLWGYSGGSLASEWAAELQESYAPELNFAGVALGGLIPNVTSVLQTINGQLFAGLAFSGIFGLAKSSASLAAEIKEQLVPSKSDEFYSIANGCLVQALAGGVFQDLYTFLKDGAGALKLPPAVNVLNTLGQMGIHGVPRMPVFAYKALGDEVSPAQDTDELVSVLCSKGAVIEYHKDILGEHATEALTGSASALSWVANRSNGIPVSNTGCVTKIVALTSLDIGTVEELGEDLVGLLESLLGGYVGPVVSG